jgi:hypothetical protein
MTMAALLRERYSSPPKREEITVNAGRRNMKL